MRDWLRGGLVIAVAGAVLAGCGGTTPSSGVPNVIIQGEALQVVPGNLCAVMGTATNTGNAKVHVEVTHAALNAAGSVGGTSTASFDLDPFQIFAFQNSQPNSAGQPSSTAFTNNLACGGIASFKVTAVNVTNA